jgi:hypothetical protein
MYTSRKWQADQEITEHPIEEARRREIWTAKIGGES